MTPILNEYYNVLVTQNNKKLKNAWFWNWDLDVPLNTFVDFDEETASVVIKKYNTESKQCHF